MRKDATDQLESLLITSVKRHLISDVPISFCLSGGLDSSTLVGISSSILKKMPCHTFTTRYPLFPKIDETRWAKMIIEHCKAKPTWAEPKYEKDFLNEIDNVLFYHDEPFASTSIFAQNTIFKAVKEAGGKSYLRWSRS